MYNASETQVRSSGRLNREMGCEIMTSSQDQAKQNQAPYVLPETRALAALGLFDLLATVYLIASHKAHEANPLFDSILHSFGPNGFVVFKALLLAIPLIIAEKARSRSPVFVRRALQVLVYPLFCKS
jgi:hypothetical protein